MRKGRDGTERGLLKAARIPVPLSMLKLPTTSKGNVGRVACNRYDARQLNCIFIYFYLGKMPTQAAIAAAAEEDAISFLLLPQIAVITKKKKTTDLALCRGCAGLCLDATRKAGKTPWLPQLQQLCDCVCVSVCVPSLLPVGWFNELPSPLCAAQLAALSTLAERQRASNNPFSFDFLGSPFT